MCVISISKEKSGSAQVKQMHAEIIFFFCASKSIATHFVSRFLDGASDGGKLFAAARVD